MRQHVSGNVRSLPPSALRRAERLFTRRLDPSEIIPLDVAREMCGLAQDLRRKVGILVSRTGRIEEVFLGTKDLLYLPDLGRYRLGGGRLRRLRLIYTDLSARKEGVTIPQDIYADLEKLRLDAVVGIREEGNRVAMAYAVLQPSGSSQPTRTEQVKDLGRLDFTFDQFIEGLEEELQSQGTVAVKEGGALLVGVYGRDVSDWAASMAELKELARTAGLYVADTVIQRRDPDPKTLLGKGKLEEVVLTCLRRGADTLVFDCELRPSQWRMITNATELKVLDRSMLILDIFAQRATSSEGRLQVELAQLRYNLPRLVEKDAGLSRLTGGIGGRGPGETKLEISRRRSRERITLLERKIADLSAQRGLRRRRRTVNDTPLVAIVGYTNVGKSTLFNRITGSRVLSENKLFATLDPASRKLSLPVDEEGTRREIVIADTVGFIRSLPVELRNAFKATLEELENASLIVHVVDATDPLLERRRDAVHKVLDELGVRDIPELEVLNKIDLVEPERREELRQTGACFQLSAATGEGVAELLRILAKETPTQARPEIPQDEVHED